MKSLEVRGTSLTTLDGDFFRYNPRIIFVDLAENLIQHIGTDTFAGLNDLFHVGLAKNTCIVDYFTGEDRITAASLALPLLCPHQHQQTTTKAPTTTIDGQCLARCSLNEKVDELKVRVDNLSLMSAKLDEKFARKHQTIEAIQKLLTNFLN